MNYFDFFKIDKNFFCPSLPAAGRQNMVRADLFSGSLAVWNFRDGAAHYWRNGRDSSLSV
jgi:hypothetical protein